MSEVQVKPVVKVARDLREIESLYEALLAQAIHKAGARIDGTSLPGGGAMVALAHVGSPDEWSENIAAAEFQHLANCLRLDHTRCRYAEHALDEDGSEPPLQTLLFWSEQWRVEHGYPIEGRATMVSEVRFLRWALEWAWDSLAEWDDFARDVNQARVRLENLLYAGRRAEQTRVVCDRIACDRPSRLIKVYGAELDGEGDYWKCPACKHRYDQRGFLDAQARHLRHDDAERFVLATDARGMLAAFGRSERTVRQWLSDDKVTWYCDVRTHQVWVWWPDLWTLHLATKQRKREVA